MSASSRSYRRTVQSPTPRRGVFAAPPLSPDGGGPVGRAARARALLQALLAQTAGLPAQPLSDTERKALGSVVFRAAPALVLQVAAGLSPDLFPDLAGRGEDLRALQDEADAWLLLRGALGRLHALCCDAYLSAQGEATRLAEESLDQVVAGHQLAKDNASFRRAAALAPAQAVLEVHRRPEISRKTVSKKRSGDGSLRLLRGFQRILGRGGARG